MKYIEEGGEREREISGLGKARGKNKERGAGDRSVMKLDKIRCERCTLHYTARLYTIHDRFYQYLVQLDN